MRKQGTRRRIAESVISSQLAACVNVIPGVRSCYMWRGELTWSDEVILLIKTTQSRFGQLQERVRELHSYEIPEIVSVEIEEGFDKYLEWIDKTVVKPHDLREEEELAADSEDGLPS